LETGVVRDWLPNGIDFSASDVEKEKAPNLQLQLRLLLMGHLRRTIAGMCRNGRYKSSEHRDLDQAALGWKARSLPGSRYRAKELLGAPTHSRVTNCMGRA
jgi:hypothetical protein